MTIDNLEEVRERLLREERVQRMVRARAYEIYEMRGGQPGWESHDWFQAEGEVLAFLIANESRRVDEKTPAETTSAASAPEAHPLAPATRESKPRPAPKARDAKQAATKKTATKEATSKQPDPKPKAKRTRKPSAKPAAKEDSAQ